MAQRLKYNYRGVLRLAIMGFLVAQSVSATVAPPHTEAPQIFMMDASTRTVLLTRNHDQLMGPSSMTKIMTAYMVFEKLKKGLASFEDRLPVSEQAWRMQGSKMFVSLGSTVSIGDLLRGVVVLSGNDACMVLAEGLWGAEAVLAQLMTEKARALGAMHTVFKNSSGWPHSEHVSTAHDLAQIAAHLIKDFPEYYPLFSEKEFTYNEIHQMNRNPLLYTDLQADGVKTGQTDAAGFGLVGSVVQNGFRVILVINGLKSATQRAHESELLMRWAFREFESPLLFRKGEAVEKIAVWLGQEDEVPVVPLDDVRITLPKGSIDQMNVELRYTGPVSAPIEEGQHIANLHLHVPHQPERIVPLLAQKSVKNASFFGKIPAVVRYLLWGSAHSKNATTSS